MHNGDILPHALENSIYENPEEQAGYFKWLGSDSKEYNGELKLDLTIDVNSPVKYT